MHGVWLWLVLSTQPAHEPELRYLLKLRGVDVGRVTLIRQGATYLYRSEHRFQLGAENRSSRREARFELDDAGRDVKSGRYPESLWVLRRSAVGCVPGIDELTSREGTLCVDASSDAGVKGRL